jgi:hypothetical protein
MATTQKEIRKYNCSDIVLLTTSSTLVENCTLNKADLVAKRTTWEDPFFPDLETRIDNLVKKYIGVDSAKDLRNATILLKDIQAKALTKLGDVKAQIEADFVKEPTTKKELLTNLGFVTYYTQAANKNQEATVNLLFQFKQNMTDATKTKITSKGTAAATINEIITYADTLNDANVTQETFKSNRPNITEEAVKKFNDLYIDILAICKIAQRFYKDNISLKETFSFTKIANAQKAAAKAKKATPKPPIQ